MLCTLVYMMMRKHGIMTDFALYTVVQTIACGKGVWRNTYSILVQCHVVWHLYATLSLCQKFNWHAHGWACRLAWPSSMLSSRIPLGWVAPSIIGWKHDRLPPWIPGKISPLYGINFKKQYVAYACVYSELQVCMYIVCAWNFKSLVPKVHTRN